MKDTLIVLISLIAILTIVFFGLYLWKRYKGLISEKEEKDLMLRITRQCYDTAAYERDFLRNELAEAYKLYDQKAAEAEQIGSVACPLQSHVWDCDGDIIRCRRCGLTRRVDNAAD